MEKVYERRRRTLAACIAAPLILLGLYLLLSDDSTNGLPFWEAILPMVLGLIPAIYAIAPELFRWAQKLTTLHQEPGELVPIGVARKRHRKAS